MIDQLQRLVSSAGLWRLAVRAGAVTAIAALAGGILTTIEDLEPPTFGNAGGSANGAQLIRVVDGDTIAVEISGKEQTVRLIGIDTPETKRPGVPVECGGPQATASLERLLADSKRVRLVADPGQDRRDRYGRLLRYVETGGLDVGKEQIKRGWAAPYTYDSPPRRTARYQRAADRAAAKSRGVWRACGGDFHSGS